MKEYNMQYNSPEVVITFIAIIAILMLLTSKGQEIFLGLITIAFMIPLFIALAPFILAFDLLIYLILCLQGESDRHRSIFTELREYQWNK